MDALAIKKFLSPGIDDILIVKLTGYVDHSNSRQVENMISEIIESGKNKIIFDFAELVYMSSAGWGVFVGEIKVVREQGGDIKIAAMTPEVAEVFQILEFFHIIEDYASIKDALQSFKSSSDIIQPKGEEREKNAEETEPINELLKETGVNLPVKKNSSGESVVLVQENVSIAADTREKKSEPDQGKNKPVRKKNKVPRVQPPERIVSPENLPLYEKIKRVISDAPLISFLQIRNELAKKNFGFTKISLFKLYRTLKMLNLETKSKRYRYYRST